MRILKPFLAVILLPGDQFCRMTGQDPREDSGMLRGFVNNIVWGAVAVICLVIAL